MDCPVLPPKKDRLSTGCQELTLHARRICTEWVGVPGQKTPTRPASFLLLVGLGLGFLERRSKDVAKARAGVGAAILRDGLLLLGDLQRLD